MSLCALRSKYFLNGFINWQSSFLKPNIALLGQGKVENILREALRELSCLVETGTELVGFEQSEHGVQVRLSKRGADGSDVEGTPEYTTYDWMIGADGARGVVRKLSGFSFLGETRTIENHVVGDIFVEGLSPKNMLAQRISLRPTETPHLFSFIIAGPEISHSRLSMDEGVIRRCFAENIGPQTELKFKDIPWVNYYVFTGGQGMNSGVQDAYNLGWKLALVQRKLAPSSLLQTYSEERIPVIREMLQRTTKILRQRFTEKTNEAWSRSDRLLQLGINYRWSSLVLDERKKAEDAEFADFDFGGSQEDDLIEPIDAYGCADGVLRAGDRAPDASGLIDLSDPLRTPKRHLFSIFGPSYHTVLIFEPAHPLCPAILRMQKKYPENTIRTVVMVVHGQTLPTYCHGANAAFEDHGGHARSGYGISGAWGIIVVRPDGVLGAIVSGAEGLQRYFDGVFGRRGN
ncbi:hypothetical protein H0H81_000693 [Sphagnurus paluster]|uniref:FAD-binding domain-containing protein n=1 Tax=Sphagnurus paluster TaxID=117069 RepID=A0A9P7GNP8_9AGAR|nr:hypothetical protein H0H81_000693 [Sphagnurus paluster]